VNISLSEIKRPLVAALLVPLTLCLNLSCASPAKNLPAVIGIPTRGTEGEQAEIEVGRQIHDAILASQYIYTKPEILNYINEVGWKLAHQSDRPHLPYTFTILVDERLYSTAAPGGYIFLTTGLLHFVRSESELAGILAHEIGEVQYQPPVFSKFKKHAEDAAALTAVIGSFFGPIGAASAMGVILLTSVPYGEMDKTELLYESDKKAVGLMEKSGYDTSALVDVLNRARATHEDPNAKASSVDWENKRPITIERIEKLEFILANRAPSASPLPEDSKRFTQLMQNI